MILTILLLLLFLTGISLFIAVVGTIFLKKRSRRVHPEVADTGVSAEEYRKKFEKGYESALESVKQESAAVREREYVPTVAVAEKRGAGAKWALISFLALGILLVTVYFGVRAYKNWALKPKLIFCEQIDYVKLKPIRKSDTFTRGNVTLFLKSKRPLDISKAKIEVYRVGPDGIVPYSVKEVEVNPLWVSFVFKVLFSELGTYLVRIQDENGEVLVQKYIHIVPDEYAFKAVPG